MKTKTNTIRARAYVRVSHVGNRQETLVSDKMQLEEARRYADYCGFDFDHDASRASADLDVSGFRKPWRQRPGLMRLFEDAQQRRFDVLIFYKISRLARNVKEALDMIDAFEKEGVSFHFVAEKIDSSSAQGRFLRNVLLAAAEMQSEDISSFIKSACERRAKDGKRQGGATPIWIDRNTLQLIPEQVENIRRLVELRLSGMGYVKIAKALNEEGRRTYNGKWFTHGTTFKYLQPSWIQTMRGSSFLGRNLETAIEIPNCYPPILSETEADAILAAQNLYSADYGRKRVAGLDWMINKRRKNGRYSASSIHLLSSIIFCPFCGSRMVACKRTDRDHCATPYRYVCPHAGTRKELHIDSMRSVAAHSVEDAVLRVVRRALSMPPAPTTVPVTSSNANSIRRIQDKIDQLVNMHLDGRIREDDYRRLYGDLIEQKEALQQRSSAPKAGQDDLAARIGAKQFPTREELRQLVLILVERVEAPLTIPGMTVRKDVSSLRRFAKVKLKFPLENGYQVFLASIHKAEYRGEKLCFPTD